MCFKGKLNVRESEFSIEKIEYDSLCDISSPYDNLYSWEYKNVAIGMNRDCYEYCLVKDSTRSAIGYFVINPENGHIQQIESLNENFAGVLYALGSNYHEVKLNNVEGSRQEIISQLKRNGLQNIINQFEMQMII